MDDPSKVTSEFIPKKKIVQFPLSFSFFRFFFFFFLSFFYFFFFPLFCFYFK